MTAIAKSAKRHSVAKKMLWLGRTCPRPLIGQKKECYNVKEVIEVDELSKGNISAASGKQYK